MNPYQFETTCSVCGGKGVSTGTDMADEWTGAKLAHSDPDVCREILAAKKKELDERDANTNIQDSEDAAQLEDRKFIDLDDEYMYEQLEDAESARI